MQNDSTLSRRDFIAATTLAGVGLWRGTAGQAVSPLLYVGTYTEGGRRDGVHLVRMDSVTGALRRVAAVDAGPNPSFLAIHPNGRTLFAVNEVTEMAGKATGSLRAFAIEASASSRNTAARASMSVASMGGQSRLRCNVALSP